MYIRLYSAYIDRKNHILRVSLPHISYIAVTINYGSNTDFNKETNRFSLQYIRLSEFKADLESIALNT